MMPNVYPARAGSARNVPFVISPRGMLSPAALKFSPGVKRLFWHLFQARAARAVNCFHATSEQEYQDIRAYGLTQPVAVIPNGIDLPEMKGPKSTESDLSKPQNPFVISLGRIHPKKALNRLILAWKEVEGEFPDWRLKIVGPDEVGYSDKLKGMVKELGLKNVGVSNPAYGQEKNELLQQAEIFALSTLGENFAMTVAESLAAGTPVVSTKGAPWRGLEENRCGWWIDHGVEPMAAALRQAMTLSPKERSAMGLRGRAWMQRDFSWEMIAQQMAEVYGWTGGRGSRPECVRLD